MLESIASKQDFLFFSQSKNSLWDALSESIGVIPISERLDIRPWGARLKFREVLNRLFLSRRFYRNALQGLRRAVGAWRGGGVDFAMHLGDIIDG